MRALQALEVLMAAKNHERGVRFGRSFFRQPETPHDLTGGYEAWTGLFQAAILGEQPFLNVDIAHKSFPKENTAIQYLQDSKVNVSQPIDRSKFNVVEDFLKGLCVEYEPPANFGAVPKTYRVLGVADSASKVKFKNDEGLELTVEAYFKSRGYKLKYPHLNCLQVGSSVRTIYLPMEHCTIPRGQALNVRKLSISSYS